MQTNYAKFFAVVDSIKSKLINGMYTDNPNDGDRNTEREFSWFLTSAELNHPDRLGNEVMMKLDDFKGLNENIPQLNDPQLNDPQLNDPSENNVSSHSVLIE